MAQTCNAEMNTGNHPLPNIYEYFVENNKHYIVIEYINGETIDIVDLNQFKEIELMNMLFELMISVHYIHSLGYICRDIKPNNIIIDNFKTAILIDFDRVLSRNEQIERKEFTRDFNHDYIAPEIINGNHFTNKADIYSLGKLIYQIFISNPLKNISNNIYSKLNIMCKYCLMYDQNERPTISQLIRYFYLNILSKIDEKQGNEKKLIQIQVNNFNIPDLFDPDGLCTLGMIFHQGLYIENDINEAIKYYTKASHQNDLISLINLFDLNINQTENIQKAIKLYPNEPLSFFLLGQDLLYSQGLINDAIKCYKSAYKLDFNGISYYLGLIYYSSNNKLNNLDKIPYYNHYNESNPLKYFLIASKYKKTVGKINNEFYNNHGTLILPNIEIALYYKVFSGHLIATISKFFIGIIYYSGMFCARNEFTAFKYFSEVAEQEKITLQDFLRKNNLDQKYIQNNDLYITNCILQNYNNIIIFSNSLLAKINIDNSSVITDQDKSLRYLLSSENSNNILIQAILGFIYTRKNDASKTNECFSLVEKNIHNFYQLNYFQILSKKLPQETQNFFEPIKKLYYFAFGTLTNDIGDAFYKGIYVPKNILKSIKFYQIASDYQNPNAQYRLGSFYIEGQYIERDIIKGICFLESSAKLNNRDSQFLLGLLFYEGEIIAQDIDKAIYYFTLGDRNACKFSRLYLGIIYCIKDDFDKAIHYFRESSNLGYSIAKNNLAILYKNKKNNIDFSIELLNEVIDATGDVVARYNLAHIYFFNPKYRNINESIKLLTYQSLISIDEGFQLLCLAIIDKYELLINNNIEDKKSAIENEIHKYNSQYKKIVSKIFNEIISKELLDIDNYTKIYDNIVKNEFLYIDDGRTILSLLNIYCLKNKQNQLITIDKRKEINDLFYEGFGEFI